MIRFNFTQEYFMQLFHLFFLFIVLPVGIVHVIRLLLVSSEVFGSFNGIAARLFLVGVLLRRIHILVGFFL